MESSDNSIQKSSSPNKINWKFANIHSAALQRIFRDIMRVFKGLNDAHECDNFGNSLQHF